VEDNPADAILVREAIHQEGLLLDIHAASDGEMAVLFIERAESDPDAPSPDAVILDLNLPKLDGFEVLRRIRASPRFCNLPVMVLTSSESRADRSEGVRLGASYYAKRPDYAEFLKIGGAIRSLLEENALL
jgi:CheY-like chemotaxis protein